MHPYIQVLRLEHWIKNGFIFLPLFFAGGILDFAKMPALVLSFFSFSIVASAIYVFNDIRDKSFDALHPVKKERPIASGRLPTAHAYLLSALLLVSGLALISFAGLRAVSLVGAYAVLHLAYSLKLKDFALIDLLLISIGFILRIMLGGEVAGVPVSKWIITMTFLLAFFLGLAKRREDLVILQSSGDVVRMSVKGYTMEFINAAMIVLSAVIIVAYLLYTTSAETLRHAHSQYLYLTSLFVILGLLRYILICMSGNATSAPVRLLYRDPFLQLTILGWIGSCYVIIYGF